MKFKSKDVQREFCDTRVKTDLRNLVYMVDGYVHDKYPRSTLLITDVHYEKGQYNSTSSTHPEWRAVDAVIIKTHSNERDRFLMLAVGGYINNCVYFPGLKGKMSPVYVHDAGTGTHLHIQVPRKGGIIIERSKKD